jgi:DNA helicase-2/ATP-dependent DNA helicase PcrA
MLNTSCAEDGFSEAHDWLSLSSWTLARPAATLWGMSPEYVLRPSGAGTHLQIDYGRELNPQQYAAVVAPPGPALVIAGAGSGKTRTLIYRVAYLLEQGVPPENILLLTFTNKAAREMMRRVAGLLGQELAALWGGTFHAIGSRILRRHADRLGYARDFAILDREDARHLLGDCIQSLGIDTKALHFPKADVLGEIGSLAANTARGVGEVVASEYDHFEGLTGLIEAALQAYQARKRAGNLMDFDDLLVLWLKLLREADEVREYYQRRFQFILVDEYQDTNRLQGEIVDLLAARDRNVMAVGDDAQSIYSWRGADFRNILTFPERYPGTVIYPIETNYRSTPQILEVANAAIASNKHQFEKKLAPVRPGGAKPAVVSCLDGAQQAKFVVQRVLELREQDIPLDRMAVLYRSHFQALELQLELTRRRIPFTITSGIRFFEQAHIKDATAYLKLVSNPRDEVSFKRLVRLLPGIGPRAAERLWAAFQAAAASATGPANLAARLEACAGAVPKRAKADWTQLTATCSQLAVPELRDSPAQMLRLVLEAGYEDYVKTSFENHRSRLEDLDQLADFARQFDQLDDFLTQMALLSNVDSEDEQPAAPGDEQLRLSTVHQAKGLEFDVVFVITLCDGLFPSQRSAETPEGEEEERRLFYVAITRARNELYLSYPLCRGTVGGGGASILRPSRFLAEIPPDLVETWDLRPAHFSF